MPDCGLSCERCKTTETRLLNEADFAILLSEGKVIVPCQKCGEATLWNLVLPAPVEPVTRTSRRHRRVLLIDDDADTLRILQLMLRPDQYRVVTAESANQALERLQNEDFDVIVSDIRMPGFDGRSLFRFLALFLPEYVSRVVFLTGDHSDKTLQFLRESNCPYTFKPIQIPELQERIREIA
jgi:CheY-like chemotaxis protein